MKFCKCGCGKVTNICTHTNKRSGNIRGEYNDYIKGHYNNGRTGSLSTRWKGGIKTDSRNHNKGRVSLLLPTHPRSDLNGYVYEHILIAEKILGKPLPPKAVVHHIDGNPGNNKNNNLIICQDQRYHILLHLRMRALYNCGNSNWFKCAYCCNYDDKRNMRISISKENKTRAYHLECVREYRRKLKERKEILQCHFHSRIFPTG